MSMNAFAQLLRLPDVLKRTGLARSTLYKLEAKGAFPQRVKLTLRSSAWSAADVEQWIGERLATRTHNHPSGMKSGCMVPA